MIAVYGWYDVASARLYLCKLFKPLYQPEWLRYDRARFTLSVDCSGENLGKLRLNSCNFSSEGNKFIKVPEPHTIVPITDLLFSYRSGQCIRVNPPIALPLNRIVLLRITGGVRCM